MERAEIEVFLGCQMGDAGDERLLKRPILGPFGEGSVHVGVVNGWLAMAISRYGSALPWHPRIEHPEDKVKDPMIAQFAFGTPLGPREVRQDKFIELWCGELDGNRRGCRVFCSCAHGLLASCAACGLYLLNQVSPNTTIA